MVSAFIDEADEFLRNAGYQGGDIVRDCTFTAPGADGCLCDHEVELVAFSGRPHDMRSACVAAFSGDTRQQETLDRLRYLSCPLAIVGHENKIELWPVRKRNAQAPFDVLDRANWRDRIHTRLADFSPKSIVAAKQDRIRFDFVDAGLAPWTSSVTSASLKTLIEKLVQRGLSCLTKGEQRMPEASNAVIRMIFHLFTCKVLEDKGVLPRSKSAESALRQASKSFSENVSPEVLKSPFISPQMVALVYENLQAEFSFATLTTDSLAHCYENALVSKGMRRRLGIHYTPPVLTEYILRRLPIEVIPDNKRAIWDPCCGCGSFLLAGFDRLASLLPESYNGRQRHQYLTGRLFGTDVDPFACELASLALVLTDLHNANGWTVKELDALEATREDLPKQPTVIVTNLPFKEIKEGKGKRRELAAEILTRLIVEIARPHTLIGVVVPQSFLDGRASKEARKAVLEHCEVLEIGLFPGGLFESAAETAVLLLQRSERTPGISRVATIRELRSGDYQGFVQSGAFTRTYPAEPEEWRGDDETRFIVSPLLDLWKRLESPNAGLRALGDVSDIRNGLQIKTADDASVMAARRKASDKPFIDRLDVLRPFALLVGKDMMPSKWIDYGPHLHRARDEEIFTARKVLINSNRNPGSAWRLVAAPSRAAIYFSDNFHAIVPKDSLVSVEQLTAILNSPVANAWFDSHCRKRKVVQSTLARLPFPDLDGVLGRDIDDAVCEMEKAVVAKWKRAAEGMFYEGMQETGDTAKLIADIDALVYDAYGLSREERKYIDILMATDIRPA